MKSAEQAVTNCCFKGSKTTCHVTKLTPQKFQSKLFGTGIFHTQMLLIINEIFPESGKFQFKIQKA